MPDLTLKPLPARFKRGYCERYRIKARKRLRPTGTGRHLQFYRGQSLEFRDFAEYTRGDDIRSIDWRASARYRGAHDFLVRQFAAEETFRLVISLDNRESMYYPHEQEKIQQAAWLAEILGRIALLADDQVYLHRLFGPPTPGRFFRSSKNQAHLFSWLRSSLEQPSGEHLNLEVLRQVIYPVAVWVVVSDFYLEEKGAVASKLGRFISEADEGWRWVILVNLDSWPYERNLLISEKSDFAWRVSGPGLVEEERVDLDDVNLLDQVEYSIRAAHNRFCKRAGRSKFDSTWHWAPTTKGKQPDSQAQFQRHFEKDRVLEQLFRRSS